MSFFAPETREKSERECPQASQKMCRSMHLDNQWRSECNAKLITIGSTFWDCSQSDYVLAWLITYRVITRDVLRTTQIQCSSQHFLQHFIASLRWNSQSNKNVLSSWSQCKQPVCHHTLFHGRPIGDERNWIVGDIDFYMDSNVTQS